VRRYSLAFKTAVFGTDIKMDLTDDEDYDGGSDSITPGGVDIIFAPQLKYEGATCNATAFPLGCNATVSPSPKHLDCGNVSWQGLTDVARRVIACQINQIETLFACIRRHQAFALAHVPNKSRNEGLKCG
jgi:hypothetical protein